MFELDEAAYEQQVIDWLRGIDWDYEFGPELAPNGSRPERSSFKDVILVSRLEGALSRINPGIPKDVIRRVSQRIQSPGETEPFAANRLINSWIRDGLSESVRHADDTETTEIIRLVDFEDVQNNDWVAINQLRVTLDNLLDDGENGTRVPDVVLYLNGMPIAVVELKNPSNNETNIRDAFNQLQTYKEQIGRLFFCNAVLVIADGVEAKVGSLTADLERFMVWRSIDGLELDPHGEFGQDRTLFEGLFRKENILAILKDFTIFVSGTPSIKMTPGYHQFFAVQKAYERSLIASAENGDGRGGLMWHTQGSGKSYEMACLSGMLATSPELKNPTIVVVTDRNDLDQQLFQTFVDAKALMRQTPKQASSRAEIRKILDNPGGGVFFTTIQKFAIDEDEESFPALTQRKNVFVMTDEAHRSQYGFSARIAGEKFKVGYAQHMRDAMPNATFIAFTGTPVDDADKNTRQVFGDEIDIYDMVQANADGATVPIYYESRLVELDLPAEARNELDALAAELTEDAEDNEVRAMKRRWAQLEQIVGAQPRLEEIAKDIITHFEDRCSSPELANGKAMVVAMSRNIAVDLYEEIIKVKPEWHDSDFRKGAVKIVFHTSASDDEKIRPHAYTSVQKRELENRFRDPEDPLRIVIVRDMWLTGYDSPPCHTMYVDKPMRGHNLMQAIARVNRVFRDKPGGLVVDYIGIATELKEALGKYTKTTKTANPIGFIEEALGVFWEKLQIVRDIVSGISIDGFKEKPQQAIKALANHIFGLEDGKKRFADASAALSKAYALVNSQAAVKEYREEIALYQAVRGLLTKKDVGIKKLTDAERELRIKQAIAKGIVPEGIVDVFSAAGLTRPDIGLLSEEFLNEVRSMKERNLAAEALGRLIKGQIKAKFSINVVKDAQYSQLLEDALARYRNRTIETAQLVEELIELAKKLNSQFLAGNPDGLNDYEVAFYDALESNEAAVREMKHEDLVRLARELTMKVKANIKVDWSVRESTQAELRVLVRNLLDKYGYPPDFSKQAIDTVLEQAKSLTEQWLSPDETFWERK
jgi:type I restriction enzyme R subunit